MPTPSAVDGIKIFDNNDQAAKHYQLQSIVADNSNVLWASHYYQKFYSRGLGCSF